MSFESVSVPTVLALALFAVPALAGSITVKDLRCEYRNSPQGIDLAAPRLSWTLDSQERAQRQSAYQILVASSEAVLKAGKGDLWDSGKTASDRTNQIAYSGKPLVSRAQCFWKVRVWDKAGKASDFSKPERWSIGLLKPEDWKASWIGVADVDKDSMPCFRKSFRIAKPIRRAVVYVSAAGLFELSINGSRVSSDYFTPGWTEYAKRIYYMTYDVTKLLRGSGENVIGAMLGDGWYGLHHGGRKKLSLLAQMHIEYTDGSQELVATDNSWKTTLDGPVLMSDIYQGETYDARLEMAGWNSPGFNDSAWQAASSKLSSSTKSWVNVTAKVKSSVVDNSLSVVATNEAFGDPVYGAVKNLVVTYSLDGVEAKKSVAENQKIEIIGGGKKLVIIKAMYGSDMKPVQLESAICQAYPGAPVRKTQEIKTVAITEPKPGVFIYDLGQNFSGWVRLRVKGEAGTKVVMRFVEMLNPDGTVYTTNLRSAKCTDTYTLKGGAEETWEPRFTFHGFRYVEVTGYPGKPSQDAITGVVLHSDGDMTSTFECSNPMLNQLQKNIVWGQRSNFFEVPTDCPQRDERMGWSGDAQVFIGTATYNMDLASFFTSWMYTFNDTQDGAGGYPNFAPRHGGVSPGWGDAGVICPWVLYRMYGDTNIIEQHWDNMCRWISFMEERSAGYLRPADGFGDWLNLGAEMPKDVIATAYFAYSTELMAKMARVIGKTADAAKYEQLFGKIKAAFNKAYVSENGQIKGDTQTTYLMALAFDLLPAKERKLAADRLVTLIEQRNWHISTGFLGVNILLPTLTDIGRLDVAYKLLQNEDYPSWGYPVKHGATTIWERWDGWTEDKGFQDPGMNSFNHYAYGSCGQWMFSTMAGIDTDGPGFRHLIIHPRPGGGITYAKASYNSIEGLIATSWKQNDGKLTLEVAIPANTTATVYYPAADAASVTESGKPAASAVGVKFIKMDGNCAVFEVGSGKYSFAVK